MITKPRSSTWHEVTPWLVLACGLVATAAVTAFVSWTARQQTEARFEAAAFDAELAIQRRIEVYGALLRAGAGLFAASTNVSRQEFRSFVERLRIQENYPGIQGIGFAIRVAPGQVNEIVEAARADGLPDFKLWPEGDDAQDRHAIYYIEPMDPRNRVALGYDMFSEPTRRVAMEKARDVANTISTAKVTLVQEISGPPQAGFLLYAPVYDDGTIPAAIEERRKRLRGFVYAPFRADDLLAGIFIRHQQSEVAMEVFNGPTEEEADLMHRSSGIVKRAKAPLRLNRSIEVGGRVWTVVFYPSVGGSDGSLHLLPPLAAVLGVFVTGLLFSATLGQRRAHRIEAARQVRITQRAALRAEIGTVFTNPSASTRSVLQNCTEALVRYMPVAFARIWTVSPDGKVLLLQASAGMYTHIDGKHSRINVGESKIGRIAFERRPNLTNDVPHDREISDPDWARREHMVAFAGYPMLVGDRVIGVVATFAKQRLSDETLETLAGVTDLIAQGVQRQHAEQALRDAQARLQKHASELERVVADRTRNLQETIRSLESFSYSIAHDLRAPLRTIHSFTSLLVHDYGQHFDEQGKDFAKRVVGAASRMDDLIQDLLAYNRVSREDLPLTPVSLDQAMANVLEQLRGDITAREAQVTVEPNMGDVIGNSTLVEQVVSNLLGNALKFVQPGVKPSIEITVQRGNSHTRVVVRDNGIGIEPAQQSRIFGVFERLHSSKEYPGTGIGLAIVEKAVERMRGKVGVEPDPGGGSRFWFELPRPA